MTQLSAFMAQNALKIEPVEFLPSKRFLDGDGNPAPFTVGAVSGAEDELLRREATRRTPNAPAETDYNQYIGLLAARCTLSPDLNNAALQNSYGVFSPDALLKTMLSAGEYADYCAKVQEVCGFEMGAGIEAVKK
jgi:hypothetical protein